MSIQIIEAYYRAFNSGDFAGMLALLAPDVIHDVNQGTREVGKDAFAEFLERMNTSYHEQLSELVIMSDSVGKRFAAEFIVDREGDEAVMASNADGMTALLRRVRMLPQSEPELLAATLTADSRDPVYEAAMRAAAVFLASGARGGEDQA